MQGRKEKGGKNTAGLGVLMTKMAGWPKRERKKKSGLGQERKKERKRKKKRRVGPAREEGEDPGPKRKEGKRKEGEEAAGLQLGFFAGSGEEEMREEKRGKG